jgi:hypothetical protein
LRLGGGCRSSPDQHGAHMLGKLPAKVDSRTLHFKSYLMGDVRRLPRSVDYTRPVDKKNRWPWLGNKRFPCCTCSAAGHMIEVWTANTGKAQVLPESAIVRTYRRFIGDTHKPHKHMIDVLNYWRKSGIGGDRILAYAQLSPGDVTEAKLAIDLFGACYLGLSLPNFAVIPGTLEHLLNTSWAAPFKAGQPKAAPQRRNGHTVAAVKYDPRNLYVVTWGTLKSMSWKFYQTYCEEAYAVLSKDFIVETRETAPSGFDLAALTRDLRHLSNRKNVSFRRLR